MIPQYSPQAALSLGFLKRSYNDIEIYVEDRSCHNMHLLLFRRALGAGVRLTSVNQVGNKEAVIAACRLDQSPSDRKRLYVIDADFEKLQRRGVPRLRHLHRLSAYCVENLIIHEEAVVAVGLSCRTNENEESIRAAFDFDSWKAEITAVLWPLFLMYAAANMTVPDLPTVSFSVYKLCDEASGGHRPSASKVRNRMLTLAREVCSNVGRAMFSESLKRVRSTLSAEVSPEMMISGKDYLLPLLHQRMTSVFGVKFKRDELKVRLAQFYDPEREVRLYRKLKKLLASA